MSNELHLDQHISKKYNRELEDLREQLAAMGGMVEEQLKNSLKSLVDADIDLAKSVIATDQSVNQTELKISARCEELIALRQPTASDLRLLLSVEKSITDLERIGDLSCNLARLCKKLIKKGDSTRFYSDLQHIGKISQQMLGQALSSFTRLDIESAIDTMGLRNKIKRESNALARQLITYMMEDPRYIKQSIRVLNAAKELERIGSHSENLCEYVVYLVKGQDIRYQDFDSIRESIINENEED